METLAEHWPHADALQKHLAHRDVTAPIMGHALGAEVASQSMVALASTVVTGFVHERDALPDHGTGCRTADIGGTFDSAAASVAEVRPFHARHRPCVLHARATAGIVCSDG